MPVDVQFRVRCDTPGCGRRGPIATTKVAAVSAALVLGWIRTPSGEMQCPRCARMADQIVVLN